MLNADESQNRAFQRQINRFFSLAVEEKDGTDYFRLQGEFLRASALEWEQNGAADSLYRRIVESFFWQPEGREEDGGTAPVSCVRPLFFFPTNVGTERRR